MTILPFLVFYITIIAFVFWLLSRFVRLTSDVHYLANQARKANGEEIPKNNPRITAVIVAVALLMLVVAIASMAGTGALS